MKIPTFEEAKQALIEKRGTPLDRFVAYWEPRDEDVKFREMLRGLVDFVDRESALPPKLEHGVFNDLTNHFWKPSTEKYEEKK